jgi:hypothetical protein
LPREHYARWSSSRIEKRQCSNTCLIHSRNHPHSAWGTRVRSSNTGIPNFSIKQHDSPATDRPPEGRSRFFEFRWQVRIPYSRWAWHLIRSGVRKRSRFLPQFCVFRPPSQKEPGQTKTGPSAHPISRPEAVGENRKPHGFLLYWHSPVPIEMRWCNFREDFCSARPKTPVLSGDENFPGGKYE